MKPYLLIGPCSIFGGPHDSGVSPPEDLALYDRHSLVSAPPGLFLPTQPAGTTGAARRLNPEALYCAMRWAFKPSQCGIRLPGLGTCIDFCTPREWLLGHTIKVSSIKHPGLVIEVRGVDWGPNSDTGRIIDLSPGAAKALGVSTDDHVQVEIDL